MATRKPRGFGGFFDAAKEAYGEGREEWSKAYREGRKAQNMSENAARWDEMTGAYPTGIRAKEAVQDVLGIRPSKIESENRAIRSNLGIGPKSDPVERAGQLLGTVGADITQDNTRSFWWLMNAAQATGNVIAEKTLGSKHLGNPKLFGKSNVASKTDGLPYKMSNDMDRQMARSEGYLDVNDSPTKGVSVGDDGTIQKRNFEPGHLAALMIPTGIAINTGLGLMTPFGGAEGYKAAMPSDDDPTKTANVVGEVGLKYFMGKTGNLLPYSQFNEARPDVSPDEYKAYQAWKFSKDEDWNPLDDGQTSMAGGALRTTNEGIHGPELQFLGRSLPVTTGIVPYLGALAGGIAGVRSKRPIVGGVGGGMAGLAIGQIAGSLLENERRRRNTVENELENPQY